MVTPLQNRVYEFIATHLKLKGYSPSLEEIARGIGISPKSISLISRCIHTLVQIGWLHFHKKGYRKVLLAKKSASLNLPVIGHVMPEQQTEKQEEVVDISTILKDEHHFMLKAQGNAMLGEGIWDGDLIICRRVEKAQEGDLVVALVDQEGATLRRISYQIPERITLISADRTLKPKAYLPHRVRIRGVFVGLLRGVDG